MVTWSLPSLGVASLLPRLLRGDGVARSLPPTRYLTRLASKQSLPHGTIRKCWVSWMFHLVAGACHLHTLALGIVTWKAGRPSEEVSFSRASFGGLGRPGGGEPGRASGGCDFRRQNTLEAQCHQTGGAAPLLPFPLPYRPI